MSDFTEKLLSYNPDIRPVINYDWSSQPHVEMNLGPVNSMLDDVDFNDEDSFTDFIFNQLKLADVPFGIGGYAEKRMIYSRNGDLFDYNEEPRTIHLGIDIWGKAGTPVHTPLDAEVHSFDNIEVHGDYGPVIILKHQVGDLLFHTLYGHMSRASLEGLKVGKEIKAGEQIGSFGEYHENYHWPPHLHFQVVIDMADNIGDYPGVCKESEMSSYLANCPDPAVLLSLS